MPNDKQVANASDTIDPLVLLYLEVYREQVARSDHWGLEALRNLTILNTAGLAGTITTYQTQTIERVSTPAILFIAGIILGYVSIAAGWLMHRLVTRRYTQNATTFSLSKNPADLFELDVRRFSWLTVASIVFGVLALLLFVIGAAALITLVKPSA